MLDALDPELRGRIDALRTALERERGAQRAIDRGTLAVVRTDAALQELLDFLTDQATRGGSA